MSQSFTLRVAGETLSACRVTADQALPTILFLHGAGTSHKERALPIAEALSQRGYGSLLFDYSGHGQSTGVLAESSLNKRLDEAEAALALLDGNRPQTVVGASMSGHIALELMKRHPSIESLVLLCPAIYSPQAFSLPFDESFTEEIRRPDGWRNPELLEAVSQFTGSLLVVIGAEDAVIPPALPPLLVETASHASHRELVVLPGIDHGLVKAIGADEELLEMIAGKIAQHATRPL